MSSWFQGRRRISCSRSVTMASPFCFLHLLDRASTNPRYGCHCFGGTLSVAAALTEHVIERAHRHTVDHEHHNPEDDHHHNHRQDEVGESSHPLNKRKREHLPALPKVALRASDIPKS